MPKLTIRDISVSGKKVLVRVDFNVPLDKERNVTDTSRIEAALPTIRFLLEHGANVALVSHLGRPKGEVKEELRMDPVASKLAEMTGLKVKKLDVCTGEEVCQSVDSLQTGEVVLLENVRFYPGEKKNNPEFAKALSAGFDLHVMDAFGTAHRAHASVAGVSQYITSVAGFLMEKEIKYLGSAVTDPEHPFVAIIGGAKVSGKLEVLGNLINKVDVLLIGGGMAYTFLKAQGHSVGTSLLEEDLVDTAKEVMAAAAEKGVALLLPVDNVIADKFDNEANIQTVGNDIPDGWMALDIGPETVSAFQKEISRARTVVWNGPMGCFEMSRFAAGTQAVCKAVAESSATSIIGGGDSVAAVNRSGLADSMTHISTGGGASLEFLEGKTLPGIAALSDNDSAVSQS